MISKKLIGAGASILTIASIVTVISLGNAGKKIDTNNKNNLQAGIVDTSEQPSSSIENTITPTIITTPTIDNTTNIPVTTQPPTPTDTPVATTKSPTQIVTTQPTQVVTQSPTPSPTQTVKPEMAVDYISVIKTVVKKDTYGSYFVDCYIQNNHATKAIGSFTIEFALISETGQKISSEFNGGEDGISSMIINPGEKAILTHEFGKKSYVIKRVDAVIDCYFFARPDNTVDDKITYTFNPTKLSDVPFIFNIPYKFTGTIKNNSDKYIRNIRVLCQLYDNDGYIRKVRDITIYQNKLYPNVEDSFNFSVLFDNLNYRILWVYGITEPN